MPAFDPADLLAPISADEPSGESLEYDVDYASLRRDAAGTPEQQMGDSVREAVEPDWRDVRSRALALFRRSHDLELANLLAVSALQTDGLPGLAAGLELVAGLLEDRWDTFHPQLDPDDGLDPLLRMNTLANLSAPPGADGDVLRLIDRLRATPLAESRIAGRFALRDFDLAEGLEPPPEGASVPSRDVVAAALRDTEPALIDARLSAARACADALGRIRQASQARAAVSSPDLSRLGDALARIIARLSGPSAAAAAAEQEGGDDGLASAAAAAAPQGPGVPVIRTQEDVLRAIDLICEYYARQERSSPVPIFLSRARRLVGRPFEEIILDMVPDAMDQVRHLGGIRETSD